MIRASSPDIACSVCLIFASSIARADPVALEAWSLKPPSPTFPNSAILASLSSFILIISPGAVPTPPGEPPANFCTPTDPPLYNPKALVAASLITKLPTGNAIGPILSLVPLPGPLNTLIPPEENDLKSPSLSA